MDNTDGPAPVDSVELSSLDDLSDLISVGHADNIESLGIANPFDTLPVDSLEIGDYNDDNTDDNLGMANPFETLPVDSLEFGVADGDDDAISPSLDDEYHGEEITETHPEDKVPSDQNEFGD